MAMAITIVQYGTREILCKCVTHKTKFLVVRRWWCDIANEINMYSPHLLRPVNDTVAVLFLLRLKQSDKKLNFDNPIDATAIIRANGNCNECWVDKLVAVTVTVRKRDRENDDVIVVKMWINFDEISKQKIQNQQKTIISASHTHTHTPNDDFVHRQIFLPVIKLQWPLARRS